MLCCPCAVLCCPCAVMYLYLLYLYLYLLYLCCVRVWRLCCAPLTLSLFFGAQARPLGPPTMTTAP